MTLLGRVRSWYEWCRQRKAERKALTTLYWALDGPNWKNRDDWLARRAVSHWHGITCDSDGYVTAIHLAGNQLKGDIPPEIGCFTHLQFLNLTSNMLTLLPAEIGQLSELKVLFLSYNHLPEIPREIGRLTKLGALYLAHNPLTSLPAEIGNLAHLSTLHIQCFSDGWMSDYEGQLTRLPAEIGNLSKLKYLLVEGHPLECIPEGVAHLVEDLPVCED